MWQKLSIPPNIFNFVRFLGIWVGTVIKPLQCASPSSCKFRTEKLIGDDGNNSPPKGRQASGQGFLSA